MKAIVYFAHRSECAFTPELHVCPVGISVWLTGVFVMSDSAGVGARGGTRCDSSEGVEL